MADHFEIPTDEKDLLRFLDDLDAEGEDAIKSRRSEWDNAVRLYGTGSSALKNPDAPGPLFRANLLAPLVRRKNALLTETKPIFDVQPRQEGVTQTAHVMRQTIRAGWDEQNGQMFLEDLAMYAQVFASCFAHLTWDSEADYGLGNIALSTIDPRQVIVDPAVMRARDLDFAQYIRVNTVAPLWTAQRQFAHVADRLKPSGKIKATEKDASTGTGSSRLKGFLKEALGGPGQSNKSAIPRVELKEYWIADPETDDDGPVYPNGKVIIRADNVICNRHDVNGKWLPGAPNPYYDGRWPFEWLDNMVDFDSAWGKDELEAIRRVQSSFNQIGNLLTRIVLVNSPPFVTADQNALAPEAVQSLRDAGHYVIEKMAGRTVERQPSPVPTGMLIQYMQFLQGLMEYVSGLQDAGGGIGTTRGRAEVRSAALLEGLQSASQVLIRAQARRLESFLERLGQKWVSRIFQFYTADRLMTVIGSLNTINSYKFERDTLTQEIVHLAVKRLQDEQQRQQDSEDDEHVKALAAEGGVVQLQRRIVALPTAGQDQILAAIKGAWRLFRFKVEPFSSLGANRIARSQLKMQLAQGSLLPSWMVLEEAGFENPKDLLQEAVQEAAQRQALGIGPMQQQKPGRKQGGAK